MSAEPTKLPLDRAFLQLRISLGRCFRAVDSMSDGSPKLIASDEQPNHQGVHAFRLGKADRPAYQPLDPGPQIDVLAVDLLRMCCADRVLLCLPMPFGGPQPSVT
jgi:hypothetical protein